jgi:PAS domain S-box-containing protein
VKDATFVIGPLDTIEEANDVACDLLGYAHAELIGMHGPELVPTERHGRTAVSLDQMRSGALTARAGLLKRKDDTIVAVAVSARVLDDGRLALTCVANSKGDR